MSPYYSDHNSRLHHSTSSYKSHTDDFNDDDDDNNYHHYHHHNTNEDDDGLLYLEDPPTLLLGPSDVFSPTQDFLSSMTTPPSPMQHYLTIEELRLARNSCWLCGCNWQQDHVSLDCPECGGYALSRPCPNCDGKCEQVWKRNINTTHDSHKASWSGQCSIPHSNGPASNELLNASTNTLQTRTQLPLSSARKQLENSGSNNSNSNNKRDKTTTTLVFDQHHTNDSTNHYDNHAAKTFPSLGQRALTKNLCPV